MNDISKLYVESRSKLQGARDKVEVVVGVGALAGAGYLFLEERPNDLEKIQGVQQKYLNGTCPEVQCGTKATDSMMANEYYGMDAGGSILLAAVSCIAIADRIVRPRRWLRKQASN